MYVRLKYIPRPTLYPNPPATVPLSNGLNLWKGKSLKLPDRWLEFIYSINSEQSANYLLKPRSGWVNGWADDGTPISESLSMGGDVGLVKRVVGDYYLLDSLLPDSPWPKQGDYLHIHKFTCVSLTGKISLPGNGLHVYFPFLTALPVYVHKSKVEVFEEQPLPLWPGATEPPTVGYQAVMRAGAIVYQRPGEVKIRRTYTDEFVRVIAEVNGWAQLYDPASGNKRWVSLTYIIAI